MKKYQVFWARTQYLASLVAVVAVLFYLIQHSHTLSVALPTDADQEEAIRVVGAKRIAIDSDSPVMKRLQVVNVETAEVTTPLMTVTGVVIASLGHGDDAENDGCQFYSSELLTAYTDWRIAVADVMFLHKQLADTGLLAETQVNAAQKLVERMERLVAIGTDTEKDLVEAQAALVQVQIQGRKDIHEAQTAIRQAQRTENLLAKQLEQAGLAPSLLNADVENRDIIIADIPESRAGQIAVGQRCEVQFLSLSNQTFIGSVHAIVPVLSAERRSVRVLLSLHHEPEDKLRPGMFAEVGLGTDPREILLAPSEAIVHVGLADYVLVQEEVGVWRVVEVTVGETWSNTVEILNGLQAGDLVLGYGAILMKPSLVKALQFKEPEYSRP